MKKKIINGILLVAVLVAASSAFVSCKDNDSDVKTEMEGKYAQLEKRVKSLEDKLANIKSCECDSYTKAEIDAKISGLQNALNSLNIPSVDGFLKTVDLPAEVQKLLVDYYTKSQVDALIAGIDIPEGLTEDQVKKMITDAITGINTGLTEDQVKKLISDAIAGINTGLTEDQVKNLISEALAGINTGLTEDQVKNLIAEALKDFKPGTDIPETITKEEIEKMIEEEIDDLEEKVDAIFLTMVTSLSADWVSNPLFGFNLPVDLKTNILLACFGEAKRDITFKNPLTGEEEPVVEAGDYITNDTCNAGKLYVTVNPSSVNFTGKTLQLVNTAGQVAPVTLSGLKPSNKIVSFATRGENAFYEADATISGQGLKDLQFSLNVGNVEETKANIVAVIKERNKETITNILKTILDIFALNNTPALRLQAPWSNDGGITTYYTYSPADIAAISWKPFGYDFDLNEVMNYDGDNMSALEKLESYAVKHATYNETTRQRIWNFLNRFNKRVAAPILNNVNAAIQPTLLIADSEGTAHPSVSEDASSFTRFKAGEIKLMPTSWTAEIVAPAFKKFVAVVAVDGQAVSADDPINSGFLGKLIPGSVTEIPLTIEAGHTYKIQFSAMDYSGNVKNLYYTIRGAK